MPASQARLPVSRLITRFSTCRSVLASFSRALAILARQAVGTAHELPFTQTGDIAAGIVVGGVGDAERPALSIKR